MKTAQALAGRADSARKGLEQSFKQLNVEQTVDSARALTTRLKATDPPQARMDGTRKAIEDLRASLKRLEAAKQQLENLERQVKGGAGSLTAGLQNLDEARKRDYAFARSLLQLPTFSAPEIGEAFFGKVSIDRFQQALYYTELARRYMPPGLLPKQDPGPSGSAPAGVNVRFPKEQAWPEFLVQLGQVDLEIGGDSPLRGAYRLWCRGHLGSFAVRQADGVRTCAAAEGSASRASTCRLDRPREPATGARLRLGAPARRRASHARHTGSAVQVESRPRCREARLRTAERPALRPVVALLQPGRLGTRQRRTKAQHARGGWSGGGPGLEGPVGGRAGERWAARAQARGQQQSRPRHRGPARGRDR